MELWIRVQKNKKLIQGLVKVDNLFVDTDIDNKWCIQQSGDTLGIYKTKERTLEVLDEIQKILQPQMVLSKVGKPIAETCDGTVYVNPDEYEIKELSTYVYEMPKE